MNSSLANPEVQLLIGGEKEKEQLFLLMLEEYKGNVKQTIYNLRNHIKINKVNQYINHTYININTDEQLREWLQEVFQELIHIQNIKAIKKLMDKNNWCPEKLLAAHINNPKNRLTNFINTPWKII